MLRPVLTRHLRALAVAAAALALPSSALAAGPPPFITLQYEQQAASDPQRWGFRVLTHDEEGAVAIAVRRCPPAADACDDAPVAEGAGTLSYEIPADTADGTSWEVTGTIGDRDGSRRTAAFRGPVTLSAAPAISGQPLVLGKAPGMVTVTPARWNAGGIGPLDHRLQVQACSDGSASSCFVLFETASPIADQDPPIVLTSRDVPVRYGGWLLRAVDRLTPLAEHPPWEPSASSLPPGQVEELPLFAAGPLTAASAFSAPIALERWDGYWPPRTPEPRDVGPQPATTTKPRVRIARTLYLRGPRTLASVRCSQACAVRVAIRGGRRSVTVTRRAAAGRALAITLPVRALRRLGAGTLRTTVSVDGRTVARGATRLAPRLRDRLRLR